MNYMALNLDLLTQEQLTKIRELGIDNLFVGVYTAAKRIDAEIFIENNSEIEVLLEDYTEDEIEEAVEKLAEDILCGVQDHMNWEGFKGYLFSYERQKYYYEEYK